MTQAVSRRPVTAQVQDKLQPNSSDIYGGQRDTGTIFLRVLRFSSVIIIPSVLHTH